MDLDGAGSWDGQSLKRYIIESIREWEGNDWLCTQDRVFVSCCFPVGGSLCVGVAFGCGRGDEG